jgi:hypothetical protein
MSPLYAEVTWLREQQTNRLQRDVMTVVRDQQLCVCERWLGLNFRFPPNTPKVAVSGSTRASLDAVCINILASRNEEIEMCS